MRHRRAVGEVTALVEAHGEDRVAGLHESEVGGEVGGGARVRLHVGMLGAEQRRRPVPGQVLDLVGDDVAAVVAPARVALGVLVREHRGRGREHRRRGEILRGDQLQCGPLPLDLTLEQVVQLGVAR